MQEELFYIVDEHDQVVDQCSRNEVHRFEQGVFTVYDG
jgi:hypothetical protein